MSEKTGQCHKYQEVRETAEEHQRTPRQDSVDDSRRGVLVGEEHGGAESGEQSEVAGETGSVADGDHGQQDQ